MDKGESSGGMPSGGLIMIVLVAAGAFFVAIQPLHTGRPVQPEQRSERRASLQDVDARLWQDPLDAVARAQGQAQRARLPDASGNHDVDQLRQDLEADPKVETIVLAVLISGGPYAEQIEGRLRMRYAVLAGLAGRFYVPSDNEHLGFFYFAQSDSPTVPSVDVARAGVPGPPADVVPFERFQCGEERYCADKRVVLLWLDSRDYVDQPLHKLARLARAVTPPNPSDAPPIRWRVLGPPSSDGLRTFAKEDGGAEFNKDKPMPFDMRFFSGAATVPDAVVLKGIEGSENQSLTDWLQKRGVHLLRTIGTDDDLGRALVHELELRGLYCSTKDRKVQPCPQPAGYKSARAQPDSSAVPSSIAIVAEWDTLYGRKLQQQFAYSRDNEVAGFRVLGWYYMRGLDGRLPGDTAPANNNGAKRDSKSESQDALGGDSTYLERPEGKGQFDYLRRLATRIRERDAQLRAAEPRGGGIRAVGVLGNDVYDKLLVLQALQSELPHTLFFTTDLDTRLLLPGERDWARNLIIASNFGLRLADPLQDGFPPFRDSYQTSAYFSTLLALDKDTLAKSAGPNQAAQSDRVKQWLAVPRVFEVSRSGFFDFSESGPQGGEDCKRWRPFQTCMNIHPPPSPMAPDLSTMAVFLLSAPLLMALWVPALAISRSARRKLRRLVAGGGASQRQRRLRAGILLTTGLALAVLPPLLLALNWQELAASIPRSGKPLSLTDGISPWPTYVIRLATFVLCVYMTAWAWAALARNVQQISRDLRLGAARRVFDEVLLEDRRDMRQIDRFASMLSVRFYRERPALLGSRIGMSRAAVDFWKHYIVQNGAVARVVRTFACVLVMFGFAILVGQAFGTAPESTQRGPLTRTLQFWSTMPAALSIQFLIFFVADATLLSVLFIRGLRLHNASWPPRTLEAFQGMTGVPAQYLDGWIDLQFVARRSRVVGRLIYFPFVALSLMLAARSPFFDDFSAPPTLYVVATVSFGIMLACAISLRIAAEASRRHGIEAMRNASLLARGKGETALASQLDVLRERMERLDEGAFAPFSRQPLLRAILLPLLTVGGTSLFDYLALLNV